jgi:hypothetical protein
MGGTKFVFVFGIVSFWFIISASIARTLNNSVSFMPQFIMNVMELAITRVDEQVFTSSFDGRHVFQLILFFK